MTVLAMMLASAVPSFAASGESEADLIAKYGTYDGKNAKKIAVLAYHNVVTDASKAKNSSSIVISASKFRKQMKYLHDRGYRTISCDELYLWHEGKIKLPKRSVLITFDNGLAGVPRNALPILREYDMKATCFLVGSWTYNGGKKYISYEQMKKLQETSPELDFQSHTYDLHKQLKEKGSYSKVLADATIMKELYDSPEYLAYPYGTYTKGMIKAYKKIGIKMCFTYGDDGYATKKQDLYKIKRISVNGNASLKRFKKWFK